MEASELMIGDLVTIPSELGRIKRVHDTFDMDYSALYRPIPLTEKILRLNGFKYSPLYGYSYFSYDNLYLAYDVDYFSTSLGNNLKSIEIKIFYVHELQHILRFCGLVDLANNFKVEEI